jgi:hypothetical protein
MIKSMLLSVYETFGVFQAVTFVILRIFGCHIAFRYVSLRQKVPATLKFIDAREGKRAYNLGGAVG